MSHKALLLLIFLHLSAVAEFYVDCDCNSRENQHLIAVESDGGVQTAYIELICVCKYVMRAMLCQSVFSILNSVPVITLLFLLLNTNQI